MNRFPLRMNKATSFLKLVQSFKLCSQNQGIKLECYSTLKNPYIMYKPVHVFLVIIFIQFEIGEANNEVQTGENKTCGPVFARTFEEFSEPSSNYKIEITPIPWFVRFSLMHSFTRAHFEKVIFT